MTLIDGKISNDRMSLDTENGILNIFNSNGGSMMFSDAARLSATGGIGISSNSSGTIGAPGKNIDIKACSGATVYIGSMSNPAGTSENSCVSIENGLLAFRSTGYATYNGNTIWNSSSKATKENISELTDTQKTELYSLLKNIPLIKYDYREQYSGQKENYGFLIEDIEDTKLGTLLHVSQNKNNTDIKYYSTEDLAKLELITIQELMKKIDNLQEEINLLKKEG
jgi:uncharacterized small protein (DUF1192 family)